MAESAATGVQPDLQAVVRELQGGDDWLIVTHERPDGDAIGSALAMGHILSAIGKQWTFVVEETMPTRFRYLPLFASAVVAKHPAERQYRFVVAVDCADVRRFEGVSAYIGADPVIINIDHHRTNPGYGTANWVDDTAAATCELVFHVAKQLNIPISVDLAKCLYTGLLTDTGGFAQPNTTREVHLIAAQLLACGVQPYDIAEPALEARSWEQMHLLQMALTTLAVSPDGKYAILYVTRGMIEGAGATDDDVEGLVGFARSIDTVEVGVLFRETIDGRVKVSLRSKRRIDVASVAQKFGGGGHVRAAGCTIDGDINDVMTVVVDEVEAALAEV